MGHWCNKKRAVIFEIGISWPGKKAEMVFYVQTQENLQIPEWTTLAAFQGQTSCFPAGARTTSLNRKQTTTDRIVKFSSLKIQSKNNKSVTFKLPLPFHFHHPDIIIIKRTSPDLTSLSLSVGHRKWIIYTEHYLLANSLHILFCIYFSLQILFLW